MARFAVIYRKQPKPEVIARLKKAYPDDARYDLTENVYLVRDTRLSADVAAVAGLKDEDTRGNKHPRDADGVVLKLGQWFSGFSEPELWTWLDEAADGPPRAGAWTTSAKPGTNNKEKRMRRALTRIRRGACWSEKYGAHPGTAPLLTLILAGGIFGADRDPVWGALLGAGIMAFGLGPLWLRGCWGRGNTSHAEPESETTPES